MPTQLTILRLIKITHTFIWALFATSILLIPVFAWMEKWDTAVVLILFVLLECIILAANSMRCPLTKLAFRYTDDRVDNFDIYLPLWLAKHNKTIFGSIFGAGLLFSLLLWVS